MVLLLQRLLFSFGFLHCSFDCNFLLSVVFVPVFLCTVCLGMADYFKLFFQIPGRLLNRN
jgi:hypothetical protein